MTKFPGLLRAARRDDLDAIVALDRETHLAPHWPVGVYEAILAANCHVAGGGCVRCLVVAEDAAEQTMRAAGIAGFAVGMVHPATAPEDGGSRLAELEDVVVAVGCRRSGVGWALCSDVLAWCRSQGGTEVVLEVRAANAGAIALYIKLGFEEVGRRVEYYREPDDDAVMMLLQWGDSVS